MPDDIRGPSTRPASIPSRSAGPRSKMQSASRKPVTPARSNLGTLWAASEHRARLRAVEEQLVVAGGLAEGDVAVGVDEPGHHGQSRHIDRGELGIARVGADRRSGRCADRDDPVDFEQHVGVGQRRRPGAVDHGAPTEQHSLRRHHVRPSSQTGSTNPSRASDTASAFGNEIGADGEVDGALEVVDQSLVPADLERARARRRDRRLDRRHVRRVLGHHRLEQGHALDVVARHVVAGPRRGVPPQLQLGVVDVDGPHAQEREGAGVHRYDEVGEDAVGGRRLAPELPDRGVVELRRHHREVA